LKFILKKYILILYLQYIFIRMTTFTSSLPDDLIQLLAEKAKELSIPKNKIIEKALRIYLDQLNKAAYIKSYRNMNDDDAIWKVAEEGMDDYLRQIEE
jgi:predicted transcriptional regulator